MILRVHTTYDTYLGSYEFEVAPRAGDEIIFRDDSSGEVCGVVVRLEHQTSPVGTRVIINRNPFSRIRKV